MVIKTKVRFGKVWTLVLKHYSYESSPKFFSNTDSYKSSTNSEDTYGILSFVDRPWEGAPSTQNKVFNSLFGYPDNRRKYPIEYPRGLQSFSELLNGMLRKHVPKLAYHIVYNSKSRKCCWSMNWSLKWILTKNDFHIRFISF